MFNWGRIRTVLLGLLLIAAGLILAFNLNFTNMNYVLAVLAIFDGVLWIIFP
jgi:uncharacterized membrane protein HdeD (DUF308 family)